VDQTELCAKVTSKNTGRREPPDLPGFCVGTGSEAELVATREVYGVR